MIDSNAKLRSIQMPFCILLTVPPGEMSERILPPAQADGKG